MKKARFIKTLVSICFVWLLTGAVFAQQKALPQMKSQELSEVDGLPVLFKHLPDWENVGNRASYANSVNDLRQTLGERPIFDLIDFVPGTEAVTAPYAQGKLLIIEFTAPQSSVETDNKVNQFLTANTQNPPVFYRRIGNYNVFVFDAPDESAANSLLDQVKYEKTIQWLGMNPYVVRHAERAFVQEASDLFVSIVLLIVSGIGLAILTGLAIGFVFFYLRDQRRRANAAFSDAGGMVRLNLDGLTSQVASDRLLRD